MNAILGTRTLTGLAYRRDKLLLPIWVYLIFIGTVVNAVEMRLFYKTPAARESLAASSRTTPALLFLYGQLHGTSIGALTAWRYGVWASLFAGLMSIFTVIRHSRANEESGRQELIGAARVGRQAPLASALLMAVAANIVAAALLCVVLPLVGLPVAGSVALALAIGACGLAFAGIAGVAAQLTSGARAARGLGIAAGGLSFLLRSIGDASGSASGTGGAAWLTWLSPLGWTEEVRAFGGERWWVLLLPAGLFAIGTWAAFALAARRDLGAGLLSDRPGRPAASAALRGPFSLAWRLQRATLFWWAVGFAFIFGPSGSLGTGITSLVGGSAAMKREFAQLGGQSALVDAYLSSLMLLAGVFAAAYAVSTVLRLRSEETGGLAEPVLSARVGRLGWGLSHVLVAVIGSAALLAVGGAAAGLGYALSASGLSVGGEVTRMTGAGLGQLPAAGVIAGVAVAAFGLFPRAAVAAGWTAFGVTLFLVLFGQAFRLSHWVLDVSPFTHAPHLPGGQVSATPLAWLSLIAVALGAAGLTALRRRDIG